MEKDDKPNDVYSYKQKDSFNSVIFFFPQEVNAAVIYSLWYLRSQLQYGYESRESTSDCRGKHILKQKDKVPDDFIIIQRP